MDREGEIQIASHCCSRNGHLSDDGNNMPCSFHVWSIQQLFLLKAHRISGWKHYFTVEI
jgi:hypothetical protein